MNNSNLRPRLTVEQRDKVKESLRKIMSGESLYGYPEVVDALVKKINRKANA